MEEVGKRVNFDTLANIRKFESCYNKKADALLLQIEPPLPATSVDWEGELWIRINPETGEITGIEIENFKRCFAKKYEIVKGLTEEQFKEFLIFFIHNSEKVGSFGRETLYSNLERTCQRV